MQRSDLLLELGLLKESEILRLRQELAQVQSELLDTQHDCEAARANEGSLGAQVATAKSACSTALVGREITAFVQQLQVRNYRELAAKLREAREKTEAAQHRHEQVKMRERRLCARLAELVGAKKGLEALAQKEQSIAAMRKEQAVEESLSELFLTSSRPF